MRCTRGERRLLRVALALWVPVFGFADFAAADFELPALVDDALDGGGAGGWAWVVSVCWRATESGCDAAISDAAKMIKTVKGRSNKLLTHNLKRVEKSVCWAAAKAAPEIRRPFGTPKGVPGYELPIRKTWFVSVTTTLEKRALICIAPSDLESRARQT